DYQALTEAARQFSASGEQVPALLARQFEELRALNRSRQKLLERLAEVRARELYLAAPEKTAGASSAWFSDPKTKWTRRNWRTKSRPNPGRSRSSASRASPRRFILPKR